MLVLSLLLMLSQANPAVRHTVKMTDDAHKAPEVITQGLVKIVTTNSKPLPRRLQGRDDTQCILKVEVKANGKVSWVTIVSAIENEFSGWALESAFSWKFQPTTRPFVTYITVLYKGPDRVLVRP